MLLLHKNGTGELNCKMMEDRQEYNGIWLYGETNTGKTQTAWILSDKLTDKKPFPQELSYTGAPYCWWEHWDSKVHGTILVDNICTPKKFKKWKGHLLLWAESKPFAAGTCCT